MVWDVNVRSSLSLLWNIYCLPIPLFNALVHCCSSVVATFYWLSFGNHYNYWEVVVVVVVLGYFACLVKCIYFRSEMIQYLYCSFWAIDFALSFGERNWHYENLLWNHRLSDIVASKSLLVPFSDSFEIGLTVTVPGSWVNDTIHYLSEFSQEIFSWVIVLPPHQRAPFMKLLLFFVFPFMIFLSSYYCLEISSYPACMLLFLIVYILGSVKTTLHSTASQEREDLSKSLSHGLAW